MRTPAVGIYQLKVTLQGIGPPIWRRFLVRDDTTLAKLHDCLQVVIGWTNSHLHHFMAAGTYYGPLDAEFPRGRDGRTVRIADLLRDPGDRLTYEYDFGDGWEHDLVLEQIRAAVPGARYPLVLAGERACPPENCGGIPGYERLLRQGQGGLTFAEGALVVARSLDERELTHEAAGILHLLAGLSQSRRLQEAP